MKKIAIIILVVSFNFGFSQQVENFFSKADAFFSTHVKNGRVDYKNIKKNPASLNELMDLAAVIQVSKTDVTTYQAFYINAYNLAVIKGVVGHYPMKSPLDVKGFFDKITYKLGGKKTTLNDLENKLLRKVFPKEARFHFVLVCAGLGCPPIIAKAYQPNILEKQLQQQTKKALNNPEFIKVKGKKVQLSQLFEWYKGDFTQNGSEIKFINKFRENPIPVGAKVSYYPYNWGLNISK